MVAKTPIVRKSILRLDQLVCFSLCYVLILIHLPSRLWSVARCHDTGNKSVSTEKNNYLHRSTRRKGTILTACDIPSRITCNEIIPRKKHGIYIYPKRRLGRAKRKETWKKRKEKRNKKHSLRAPASGIRLFADVQLMDQKKDDTKRPDGRQTRTGTQN